MLFVVVAVASILLTTLVHFARTRAQMEWRADLLDLLAAATRRSAPLPSLLRASAEGRGPRAAKRSLDLVERLESGASLADAVEGLGRRLAPPHLVAAIRAAEGTSRLPTVLEAQASDAARALEIRHRVLLATLYPVFLAASVLGLHAFCVSLYSEIWYSVGYVALTGIEGAVIAVVLVCGLALAFAGAPLVARLGIAPGARLVARARILRTTARLLEAGLPLDEAVRRAADAGGHRRVARRVRAAATHLQDGDPLDVLTGALGLPASERVRIAAAGPRLALVLGEASTRLLARFERAVDAWLRWLRPLGVAAVGVLVFVDFHMVMGWLEHARTEAMPW